MLRYLILVLVILINISFGSEKFKKVSVQLNWKYQFEFAGYIVAKEKGFYKNVGLDVTLKEYQDGLNIVDDVLQGKSTFGIYNSSILQDYLKGKPLMLVASIFKRSALVIVAQPEIKTLQDLSNKTIMAATSDDFDFNFKNMFVNQNLDTKKLHLIPHTYNIQSFVNKKCDAMTAYISDQPYKLDKAGVKYTIFDPSDYGVYSLQSELFTKKNTSKEFLDMTSKFQQATIKGWKYALTHKKEVAKLIYDKYSKNIPLDDLIAEAKAVEKLVLPYTYKIGSVDKNFLERQLELYNIPIHSYRKLDGFIFDIIKKQKRVELTAKELKYLKQHPIITAQNEAFWPPFNYIQNHKAKGFSIDYMNLVAKKLGIKVKYIQGYTWSQYVDMIKNEKLDILLNTAKNKERSTFMNFTQPYIQVRKAIFSNIKDLKTIDDLKGRKVAIPDQFFIHKYLKDNYPDIKLVPYKNIQDCIYAVVNKEVDALVGTYAAVNYFMQKEGVYLRYSNISKDKKFMVNLRVAVRKSQVILKNILQKAMEKITDEEINELKQKWFNIKSPDKNSLTLDEQVYLNTKKTLKVCTNPNWTPIEFIENNKPQGISIDTLKIISKHLKLPLEFIKTSSWSQSQEFLKERKCDILPSAIKTVQRTKYANFTKPYLNYDLAIVTKNDKPLVSNLDSIIKKTMARKKGSGLISKLKIRYPKIKIIETKGYEEAFQKVSNGEVYFTIATLPVLSYYKNKLRLNNLQIAGYTKMKYHLSIAVRNDDIVLLNILNKELNKIDISTKNLIYEKWTRKQVEFKTDYTLLWQLGLLFIIILIIILFFNIKQRKLKEEVIQLNKTLETKIKIEVEKNRQKDKQLLYQNRRAQMGEMINMIAHQWRQPLTAISSTSASIKLKVKLKKLDDNTAIELADKILYYSKHLSSTINDFRDFFHDKKEKQNVTYNELIEDVLKIIRPSLENKHIKLVQELDSQTVLCTHPNEVKQVILNLIKNAEDALVEQEIENPVITIKTYENILLVKDNAGGIKDTIINKIFDPYFSTKKNKDGTGLGLYMSKTIIHEHCGGSLDVTNDEQGAVFTVKLPLEEEK